MTCHLRNRNDHHNAGIVDSNAAWFYIIPQMPPHSLSILPLIIPPEHPLLQHLVVPYNGHQHGEGRLQDRLQDRD